MNRIWNIISRKLKIPTKDETKKAINSFSKKEYIIFIAAFIVLLISTVAIVQKINQQFLVEVPDYGGELIEGVVGSPRFINPLLQFSDTDKDLTALVYSGLLRRLPDGRLIGDLAEKYEVSENGLSYTFTLKDNIYFHDNEPVTIDDVIFTIEKAIDTDIKSPKKVNWEGVEIEKIDQKILRFTLKQPYAPFLENTILGILPMHLWQEIPDSGWNLSDLNINAVGSGPYKISQIKKKSGLPKQYKLKSFSKFSLGKPYISNIVIKFYSNETELVDALKQGEVEQINSISPENAKMLENSGFNISTTVLPRVFSLFFNQNEAPIFTDKKIIEAFNKAIDKERIIREVLLDYGVSIESPLPPNLIEYANYSSSGKSEIGNSQEEAKKILESSGWKLNEEGIMEKEKVSAVVQKITQQKKTVKSQTVAKKEVIKLEFSLATSDIPELQKAAQFIKEDLEKIGAKVEIKIYETGSLNQEIIRPRKYETMLFGQIINHESDLFAFWHSSQRNDPGLNIAMYTNSKVDKLLEGILTSLDKKETAKKYLEFESEIKKDLPAVFIYSPEFIYVTKKSLDGISSGNIRSSSDRLAEIYQWNLKKDNVWSFFNN